MMTPKRSLEETEDDIERLERLTKESEELPPRRRKFQNVQPMTQYDTQPDDKASMAVTERAGYLKQIKLTNFMCHANFSLRFGPKLNFIVGNNGSGKSAILTAITVGLGAKATTTNRGTSLKDLIRQGCNTAKITLVLCNEGLNSFEPEIYGSEIRVERTLKREGSSGGFSIRTENNKEVSGKKRDLEAILDYFSIPIMNPMCFLSQDAARSFLTASSAQDKYLHFMRGTLLEETKDNLEAAENTMVSSKNRLSLLEDSIRLLQSDYEHAQTLLNELVSRNDWISRRRLLQGKHLWLVYHGNVERKNEIEKKKATLDAKKQNYSSRIAEAQNKIERYQVQKEECMRSVSDTLTERQTIEAEKSSIQIEIEKFKREHTSLKDQQRVAQEDLKATLSSQQRTLQEIKDAEAKLRQHSGEDRNALQHIILEREAEIEQLNAKMPSLHEEKSRLRGLEKSISEERAIVISELSQSVTSIKQELKELQSSEDKLAHAFDRKMPQARQMIKAHEKEFSAPPIGPVGYYITLKSGYEESALLIQTHINATLGAFVVQTSHDALLLRKIFKACNMRRMPIIITYKLSSFNYLSGKASTGTTIADVLSYDIPELEYLLVDQNRIEKTVLVKNKSEGDDILRQQQARNVNLVLASRDGSSGLHMALGNGSAMRLNVVPYSNTLRFKIGGNKEFQFLKDKVQAQEQKLQERRAYFTEEINKLRLKCRNVDEQLARCPKRLNSLGREVDELRDKLNMRTDSSHLTVLNETLNEQKEEIEQLKANLESLDQKISDLGLQLQPVKLSYDNVTKKYEETCAAYESFRNMELSLSNKIDKLFALIHETQEKMGKNNEKVHMCEDEVERLHTRCQEQFRRAQAFCDEEELSTNDLPSTEAEVLREINKIDENVRTAERHIGMTQEEITSLFERSKAKYDASVIKYNQLDLSLQKMYTALMLRRAALELSVKGTCTDADIDFRTSMKTRTGYSGSLSFKTAGQLNVMVQTINDASPRNVDTLSGGEKSFSQIALLLATWLTMRSRIIALDEFDVFMDQVNRKIGTDLIIRRLGKDVKSDTQTIIITPQDIGKMTNIDDQTVNIHKMKNPER